MKKVYLIAVIFALLAGFATYMFATQLDAKTTIKDKDTVKVYVALQDIPKNTEITEDMVAEDAGYFELKDIVVDYAVENPVSHTNAPGENDDYDDYLVGMITVDPIYAGEQMSTLHLISVSDDTVSLSFKLDKGKVAYSFSSGGSVSGVDGYITEGDSVDVIVYTNDDNGEGKAEVVYQDLKILRVAGAGDQTSEGTITSYSTLTVQVTEKQALELYEIENNYSYKLVLNPRD